MAWTTKRSTKASKGSAKTETKAQASAPVPMTAASTTAASTAAEPSRTSGRKLRRPLVTLPAREISSEGRKAFDGGARETSRPSSRSTVRTETTRVPRRSFTEVGRPPTAVAPSFDKWTREEQPASAENQWRSVIYYDLRDEAHAFQVTMHARYTDGPDGFYCTVPRFGPLYWFNPSTRRAEKSSGSRLKSQINGPSNGINNGNAAEPVDATTSTAGASGSRRRKRSSTGSLGEGRKWWVTPPTKQGQMGKWRPWCYMYTKSLEDDPSFVRLGNEPELVTHLAQSLTGYLWQMAAAQRDVDEMDLCVALHGDSNADLAEWTRMYSLISAPWYTPASGNDEAKTAEDGNTGADRESKTAGGPTIVWAQFPAHEETIIDQLRASTPSPN